MALEFVLLDLDRSNIVNWDSKGAKQVSIDPNSQYLIQNLNLWILLQGNQVSEATVSKLFTAWINYAYLRLGNLKIWPKKKKHVYCQHAI